MKLLTVFSSNEWYQRAVVSAKHSIIERAFGQGRQWIIADAASSDVLQEWAFRQVNFQVFHTRRRLDQESCWIHRKTRAVPTVNRTPLPVRPCPSDGVASEGHEFASASPAEGISDFL